MAGFAALLFVVAGFTFIFGSGSHPHDDEVKTVASTTSTSLATTTTLFAQSNTSSTTSTTTTTTTTTLVPPVAASSSGSPVVNVASFDPQCGPYITVTARVDGGPIRSVTIGLGNQYSAMTQVSQGVWQATVSLSQASEFLIVATDASGNQGTTGGTLYFC